MIRVRGLWTGGLMVWVGMMAAGCVSLRREGAAEVVVRYRPLTMVESLAQGRLLRQDDRARVEIERVQEAFAEAREAYGSAWWRFHAKELRPGQVRPTREEVGGLLIEAREKWRAYRAAITGQSDRYEAFLERYPHNWYARHRYAWFLADHQRQGDAAEQWRRVTLMEPRFPYAYNNLGSLYNHMGRDIEAVELYRTAIAMKGDVPEFHLNLAVNYSTQRYEVMKKFGWDLPRIFRECIASYERARALAPEDKDIARDLASQYVLAKYFKVTDTANEAIEAWIEYLDLDLTETQRGIACRNLGRIYLTEKKDAKAAIAWLTKAVELLDDPGSKTLLDRAKAALGG